MSEITYEALKGLKDLKSLPILTLDERWYHLVTDKIKKKIDILISKYSYLIKNFR